MKAGLPWGRKRWDPASGMPDQAVRWPRSILDPRQLGQRSFLEASITVSKLSCGAWVGSIEGMQFCRRRPPWGWKGVEHWGMGGGANGSSKLNDGAGLGTCKDCDGVRLGSGSERLGVGRDGPCGLSTRAESGKESRGYILAQGSGDGASPQRVRGGARPPDAGAAWARTQERRWGSVGSSFSGPLAPLSWKQPSAATRPFRC